LLVLILLLLLQILLPPGNVADAFACVHFDVASVAAAIDAVVFDADLALPLKP
jgi:hypothetical protein